MWGSIGGGGGKICSYSFSKKYEIPTGDQQNIVGRGKIKNEKKRIAATLLMVQNENGVGGGTFPG